MSCPIPRGDPSPLPLPGRPGRGRTAAAIRSSQPERSPQHTRGEGEQVHRFDGRSPSHASTDASSAHALPVGPRAITPSGGQTETGRRDMHHESLLVVSSRGESIGKVIHYDGDETFSVEGG